MTFDQAQSPRLGQRTPVESTVVQMFSGAEIPEAAWTGQMIYRTDTQALQVYNGTAFEDVVGGVAGLLTFVGSTVPVSVNAGDIWFNSADGNHPYRAEIAGADAIAAGEWVSIRDGSIATAQTTANNAQTAANNAQSTANGVATAAPTGAPVIEATGIATGIVITSDQMPVGAAAASVEYHLGNSAGFTADTTPVTGTLLAGMPTRSTVVVVNKQPNGTDFDLTGDTNYYVRGRYKNSFGYSSTWSNEVEVALDPDKLGSMVTAVLQAGFIYTGSIQIGNISIDAEEGFKAIHDDGSETLIPIDGSPPSYFGKGYFSELKLTGPATVDYGSEWTVSGNMELSEGVTPPETLPTMTSTLPGKDTGLNDDGFQAIYHGLTGKIGDSTKFITVGSIIAGGSASSSLVEITHATGATSAVLGKAWFTGFGANGGIINNGTNYYVLGYNNATAKYQVIKLDTSYNEVSRLDLFNASGISGQPAIGIDGGSASIFTIAYAPQSGTRRLRIRRYFFSDHTLASTADGNVSGVYDYAFVSRFSATYGDMGTTDTYVASTTLTTASHPHFALRLNGSTWDRDPDFEWKKPSTPEGVCGMHWDGTRFWLLDKAGYLFEYSTYGPTTEAGTTIFGTYAWVSTDGTKLTTPAPDWNITLKRWWARISSPVPPQRGDATADAASKVRYYLGLSDTTMYQVGSDTSTEPWLVETKTIPTSGTGVETVDDFASVAAPGTLTSAADNGARKKWELNGDGSFLFGPDGGSSSVNPGLWMNDDGTTDNAIINPPYGYIKRASGVNLASGTSFVAMTIGTGTDFMTTNDMSGTASDGWAPGREGVYWVGMTVGWDNSVTAGQRAIQIRKGTTTTIAAQYASGSAIGANQIMSCSTIVHLTASDDIRYFVCQNSGSTIQYGNAPTTVSIVYLGPKPIAP